MADSQQNIEKYIEQLSDQYGNPRKEPVTPFERVRDAIERKQPDRVPFDFWAVPETIEKLQSATGAKDVESLLQLLGVDCRIVEPAYVGPERQTEADGSYYAVFGTHRKRVTNEFSTYDEYASFPLSTADSPAAIEAFERWPNASFWDWTTLPGIIADVNQDTRYHIRYDIGGIFETSWGLYGMDKFLMDLIQRPELPLTIMDCVTNILIDNFKHAMQHAGGLIDMVYTYDDVAIQNGLLMSKKMWRNHILPFHQKLNAEIRKFDVKILYHSCGAVYDLIDPFIDDMRIDVLNPLQPRAAKMDMRNIKANFGKRVSFHGGIDIQETLPHGSADDVRDEVRNRCSILGEGGGYICTSAHYIQADTPIANILAMYAADRSV
jgi:uroporphyrinogen decarboxylase